MENSRHKILVKKYFIFTFSLCLAFACFFCATFYIIDPFQFFHKSWFNPPDRLAPNMRMQAAGLLRNYEFDSIILGTSMLENTSSREAGEKLGGIFINISMPASNFYERSFPLNTALKRGIKNVIYSVDICCIYPGKVGDKTFPLEEWTFLYDDNPINDILYYATLANLRNLFIKEKNLYKLDLDRPGAWFKEEEHARRFGGLEKWAQYTDYFLDREFLTKELPEMAKKEADWEKSGGGLTSHSPDMEKNAKDFLDEVVFSYVKSYPQTRFYFVFPPYSRYFYARLLKSTPELFSLYQEMVRYFVAMGRRYPNMEVFGLEDRDFPDDLANYKDTMHHSERINSLMLDVMMAGEKLTPYNVEAYLAITRQKARDFDIGALNAQAQRILREGNSAGRRTP